MRAQPSVSLFTRVNLETAERRHRLQSRTGRTTPDLISEALKLLEIRLNDPRSSLEETR
jgi:predicted DNA-binding protein